MWQFKKINVSGMGNCPNTQMLLTYKSLTNSIEKHSYIYHTAYVALQALNPSGTWSHRLKPLHDKDIRGPGKDPNDPTQSSQYEPSWIWLVVQNPLLESEFVEEDFNESMCGGLSRLQTNILVMIWH